MIYTVTISILAIIGLATIFDKIDGGGDDE